MVGVAIFFYLFLGIIAFLIWAVIMVWVISEGVARGLVKYDQVKKSNK